MIAGRSVAPPPAEAARPEAPTASPGDWGAVRAAAAGAKRQVRLVLEEASIVETKGDRLALNVSADLMTAALGAQEEIQLLIGKVWGKGVKVEFAPEVLRSAPEEAAPVVPSGPAMTVANATEHPLIRRAVELLGAKVVGVYPRRE